MISGRFTYASTKVGFGSAFGSGTTAWEKLKSQRASIANNLASTQASLASFTSALASAQQDNISGLGTLAAQAAIARVRADAKAKSAEITSQIDSAQKAFSDTTSKKETTTIIGHTVIQPYVSWGSPPGTVDTTNDHSVMVVGNTVIQKTYHSWALSPSVDTEA